MIISRYVVRGTEYTECHAGFLSSRPNWLPRPLARKRVLPPPLLVQGGGGHACGRAGGGSQFGRRDRYSSTLGIYSIIPLRLGATNHLELSF
jgi:hypothetical protein